MATKDKSKNWIVVVFISEDEIAEVSRKFTSYAGAMEWAAEAEQRMAGNVYLRVWPATGLFFGGAMDRGVPS